MQDNLQCRKCKASTEKIKINTKSRKTVDNECQVMQCKTTVNDFDGAKSVGSYDENEFEHMVMKLVMLQGH
jgi:hypothetical protein